MTSGVRANTPGAHLYFCHRVALCFMRESKVGRGWPGSWGNDTITTWGGVEGGANEVGGRVGGWEGGGWVGGGKDGWVGGGMGG
jgi:hypothetical protein